MADDTWYWPDPSISLTACCRLAENSSRLRADTSTTTVDKSVTTHHHRVTVIIIVGVVVVVVVRVVSMLAPVA